MQAHGGSEANSARAPEQGVDVSREISAGKLWPALLAIALGAFIILGVGFAPGIAHDAAHDTRHTLLFPCH